MVDFALRRSDSDDNLVDDAVDVDVPASEEALAVLAVGKASLPAGPVRWATAALLVGFGVLGLVRHRHPRWVGMRVGFRDLTLWSFLMATAHGAGLMLLPLFVMDARRPPATPRPASRSTGRPATSARPSSTPRRCSS